MDDQARPRVRRVNIRLLFSSSRASFTQVSPAFKACSCAGLGAISASKMSRLDSTPSRARRVGQPTPPPRASTTANDGFGLASNTLRSSSTWSGLALRHRLSNRSPSPSGNTRPQAAKGLKGSFCLASSSTGAEAGTYTNKCSMRPWPKSTRACVACSRLVMLLALASTTRQCSLSMLVQVPW
ncbi:hypothetical protein QFZ98_008248 [Paraburkholderia youngii]